jgi:hypothetical protein
LLHHPELLVLGHLRFVDPEVLRAAPTQITAVARVADQRLVPRAELLSQRRHDRLPVGGVLAGLVLVETDDVPAIAGPHLLDLQG